MLYIGNFYYVSNQEEALDPNRRHGEFNLMIEADNIEVAVDSFRSRIVALQKARDFFGGDCSIYFTQIQEVEGLPRTEALILNYKSYAGDPFMPFIGCIIPSDQIDACKIHNWERKQAELNLQSALSQIKELKEKLEVERAYLQEEIKLEYNYENIIGQSDGFNYVLYKVEQIAPSDTTVLVLGETGTGKELVARAIHGLSPRKDRTLVKVNCATLPSNLIESELFGHEKGAFTGAHARQLGRFEVANGATLFLDEIGELPL
jgi:transcriptional regulator with PAS, ATPase and Fis domain